MDFKKFNKGFEKIDWEVNTDNFEYKSLKELFESGVKELTIKGFFFSKSDFGLQANAITDSFFVNLPKDKNETIQEILKEKDCISSIKNGECKILIRDYHSKKYNKQCFTFDFV